ncbi:hypothetical protein BS78_01G222300 [Paspalum vaginatum]|uniref:Myb-like domain-containing protein n=1 Tax=Paspalum vaginatum TaxID=158149 RepID=A0A9W8CEI2_9POAL|nr:hypothetical protein BS78_K323500 [Paspalum vaginatum]KAJ1295417.1 hypothetical protein BS78_01G222300 [Paspalum vaginatum]
MQLASGLAAVSTAHRDIEKRVVEIVIENNGWRIPLEIAYVQRQRGDRLAVGPASDPMIDEAAAATAVKMDEDEEAMYLSLLWTGPRNEKHLDACLEGLSDHQTHQVENEFHSPNVKAPEEAAGSQIIIDDIKDCDPSMLDGNFRNKRRGPQRKSRSVREPSIGGGKKYISRKNNDHWTQDEVRNLVNGVSLYGVGYWRYVKEEYFSTSIRTTVHLKDKWKNLLEACKKKNGRMLVPLEPSLVEQILEIDDKDPYPKKRKREPQLPSALPVQWTQEKGRTKRLSKSKWHMH